MVGSAPLRLFTVMMAGLLLQLTVFVDLRVVGVAPELLALFAVAAGLLAGPDRGPYVAFGAGLLWDVYLPTPLGVSAVVFAVTAYGVARFSEELFQESRLQVAAILGLASGLSVIGYALLGSVVGGSGLISFRMLGVAVVVSMVNGLLTPIIVPAVSWALEGKRVFQ